MDYSLLVSELIDGDTIKLPFILTPANKTIRPLERTIILDTGASNSSFTKEFLTDHGYGRYTISDKETNTAVGPIKLKTCCVKGIKVANNFEFPEMTVNVLEGWNKNKVVGVIGMDILSQLTFLMSHEAGQFLLTDEKMPELTKLFNRLTPSSVFSKR